MPTPKQPCLKLTWPVEDTLRVGPYMIRAPAASSRLTLDTGGPVLKYFARGSLVDHGENPLSASAKTSDYLDWIARNTTYQRSLCNKCHTLD
jgi:hypothetical protein